MLISLESTPKELIKIITDTLNQTGMMFRIFGRLKNKQSLSKKINRDPRYGDTKKIQDLIGIRVVLYFADDIKCVHQILDNTFTPRKKDESIDDLNLSTETFKPVRYNLVYEIPNNISSYNQMGDKYKNKIDNTFEIQIRTVLSEGWHEVEHDLRFKYKDDWNNYPCESRRLNGVYAALETNEWTMIKVLEDIAYQNYKNKNWESMLRQKFRLRLTDEKLDEKIIEILDNNNDLAKKLYRMERIVLISTLKEKDFCYPINLTNLVYFSNICFFKDENLLSITPEILKEDCE